MIAESICRLNETPRLVNGESLSIDALPTSANGRPPRPFQIVSLLDMVEFPLVYLADMHLRLSVLQREAREKPVLTPAEQEGMIIWMERLELLCSDYEMDVSYFTGRAIDKVKNPSATIPTLDVYIGQVRSGFQNELRKKLFLFMPSAEAKFWNQHALFGPDVEGKFSGASGDIQSAGNCYAAGQPTACVYHLMRVSEFGLRYLAARLRVKLTHKGKPMPVEYATWDKVITACKNKITLIRQKPIGPKRHAQLELYSDAGDHCLFMKDIWRNNASHTRKPYTPAEAMAAFERVRDFMKFLAANEI